jgi:hypothetical protein
MRRLKVKWSKWIQERKQELARAEQERGVLTVRQARALRRENKMLLVQIRLYLATHCKKAGHKSEMGFCKACWSRKHVA